MTTTDERSPAEERLLDAALQQVFAARGDRARAANTPRWLFAALCLLGLGITATTMWQALSPQRDEAQEPQRGTLDTEVPGVGKAGIDALPLSTTNLLAKLVDPNDLQAVSRLVNLRALRLWPEKTTFFAFPTGYDGAWSEPPADLLKPLAQLAHLEVLRLPPELALRAELFAPLADHPTLREIQFVRNTPPFDEAFAYLRVIPYYSGPHHSQMPIAADTLRALAKIQLESIAVDYCFALDADGWQALRSMHSLQRLTFMNWHLQSGTWADASGWKPSPTELLGLRDLPKLRALELLHCNIDNEQLGALPDTLTTLHLFGTALTPDGFRTLRRFGRLRDLVVDTRHRLSSPTFVPLFGSDPVAKADATASALSTLRLRSLRFAGALTPALVAALENQTDLQDLSIESQGPDMNAAIVRLQRVPLRTLQWRAPVPAALLRALAQQPHLRELTLAADDFPDLAPLAEAQALQKIQLIRMRVGSALEPAAIAPLARAQALRELHIDFSVFRSEARPSQADLQRAAGDRLRVTLKINEFTQPK